MHASNMIRTELHQPTVKTPATVMTTRMAGHSGSMTIAREPENDGSVLSAVPEVLQSGSTVEFTVQLLQLSTDPPQNVQRKFALQSFGSFGRVVPAALAHLLQTEKRVCKQE